MNLFKKVISLEIITLNGFTSVLQALPGVLRFPFLSPILVHLEQVYLEKNGGVFIVINGVTQLSCGGKSVHEQRFICHISCIFFFFCVLQTTFQSLLLFQKVIILFLLKDCCVLLCRVQKY